MHLIDLGRPEVLNVPTLAIVTGLDLATYSEKSILSVDGALAALELIESSGNASPGSIVLLLVDAGGLMELLGLLHDLLSLLVVIIGDLGLNDHHDHIEDVDQHETENDRVINFLQ